MTDIEALIGELESDIVLLPDEETALVKAGMVRRLVAALRSAESEIVILKARLEFETRVNNVTSKK